MKTVVDAIDASISSAQEKPRTYLGGSAIGEPCERKLVYSFRQAALTSHSGRMMRLFNRGHREEERFVEWLRRVGFEVQEFADRLVRNRTTGAYSAVPWRDPLIPDLEDVSGDHRHIVAAELQGVRLRQWGFKSHGGHFAGHGDGQAQTPNPSPDDLLLPGQWVLLEFKTYNLKNFGELKKLLLVDPTWQTLKRFNPKHYAQMQTYMLKFGLTLGLYMAINKNDDDMVRVVVPLDPVFAQAQLDKATRVISASLLPPRIGNHPSFYECKFCDFRRTCHYGELPLKSCRSCVNGHPVDGGRWHCSRWASIIPVDAVAAGCNAWTPITD